MTNMHTLGDKVIKNNFTSMSSLAPIHATKKNTSLASTVKFQEPRTVKAVKDLKGLKKSNSFVFKLELKATNY